MFKEIRQGLADSERVTRQLAASQRLMDSYRPNPRRWDRLEEFNRLSQDRDTLSRQLLEATTTMDGAGAPAYVAPQDVAAIRRKIAALDVRLGRMAADPRLMGDPSPHEGVLQKLGADLKVEMSVIGHQLLLVLGLVVAYTLFFLLLFWAFPYVWDWFWSFP